MKNLMVFFIACFFSTLIYGQDTVRCNHLGRHLSQKQLKERELFEIEVQKYLGSELRVENTIITIPVVVHVVYNKQEQYIPEEQVYSQIKVLNQDYGRTNSDTGNAPAAFHNIAGSSNIRFKLAVQDPLGKPTNGITYTPTSVLQFSEDDKIKYTSSGGIDAWDPNSYLNIWVSNLRISLLGYFPGDSIPIEAGKSNDGVVISYKAFGTIGSHLSSTYYLGRTSTHEIGHWLGLYHLWGPPWGTDLCSSDFVFDTPRQKDDSKGCPKFPSIDSECNNGPYGRNFSNFMDYSNDVCMNMFTKGQVQRMNAILNISRQSILNSQALVSPYNKDLALSIVYDTSDYCSGKNVYPKIRIFNYGKDTVSDYSISITYNGNTNQYTVDGKLIPLEDTLLTFNDIQISSDQVNMSAEVAFGKDIIDEYPSNNVKSLSFKCIQPLSIHPNPVSETLYVKGNFPKVNSSTIYNLQGTEVLKVINTDQIDVSSLEPGFYLIILETDEKAIRKQLIVVK